MYYPIGLHVQAPLRPDQWDMILAGVRHVQAAGKRLVFTIVNESGLPKAIKAIMPAALVFYRPVFSAHDPTPRTEGWPSGESWFNRLWPHMQPVEGVDAWIFANEAHAPGNKEGAEVIRRFNQFYEELVVACAKRSLVCTVGDFPPGKPGHPSLPDEAHYLPLIQGMLSAAEEHGMWLNYHAYCLTTAGATDMQDGGGAAFSTMRWEIMAEGRPRLKIVGGETANAGKDATGREGVFRSATPALQEQFARMILASQYGSQFAAGCWWQICDPDAHRNPEADWSKDDFTPVLPQFFNRVALA